MPKSSRQSGDDELIDDYVCGRLTPEDQLEFEAEFIGKPGLVKRIEEAYVLKQCLDEAKKQGVFSTRVGVFGLKSFWRYFAVPQTAWGAIAASLLFAGFFFSKDLSITPVPVHMLTEEQYRSYSENPNPKCEIAFAPGQTQKLAGFVVPSSGGGGDQWDIEILDENNKRIWFGKELSANVDSVIFLRIDLNRKKHDLLRCIVKRNVGVI